MVFNDARRFGLMDLTETARLAEHPLLRGHRSGASGRGLYARRAGGAHGRQVERRSRWCCSTRAGGGRDLAISYASEALYRAGIAPTRAAFSLKPREIGKLVPAVKDVLTEAIAAAGSSLRDHRRPDGELGYFQHGFKVYDRAGEPCPDCTCREGIRRLVQGGRSTFYCAKKQR